MDVAIMIAELRKTSLLWDVKNKDCKNRVVLKKGWKEIPSDTLKTDACSAASIVKFGRREPKDRLLHRQKYNEEWEWGYARRKIVFPPNDYPPGITVTEVEIDDTSYVSGEHNVNGICTKRVVINLYSAHMRAMKGEVRVYGH